MLDNISITVQSDYSVLIEKFNEFNNKLEFSTLKKFNSEEEAKLFVQKFSHDYNVK